jgi:hypothetical protein
VTAVVEQWQKAPVEPGQWPNAQNRQHQKGAGTKGPHPTIAIDREAAGQAID